MSSSPGFGLSLSLCEHTAEILPGLWMGLWMIRFGGPERNEHSMWFLKLMFPPGPAAKFKKAPIPGLELWLSR